MKFEQRQNILSDFDFKLLDDPDFQEDSVREEIIVPILKGLGYSAAPPYKIIRSKKLVHPFVSIGSATKNIYIIPDYLLEVDGQFAWTLEAKAPNEGIINTKHVEQAYSYAIHSEIRVPYFALCNGREFVLYHISKTQPVVHLDMLLLSSYWDNLVKLLSPSTVLNYDSKLSKDFGLHIKRLGFEEFSSLIFPDVPIMFIQKMTDNHYTFSTGIEDNGSDYVVSFDFDSNVLLQLQGKIPDKAFYLLQEPLANAMKQISFRDAMYRVTIDCRVGETLAENESEIFLPLRINRILG